MTRTQPTGAHNGPSGGRSPAGAPRRPSGVFERRTAATDGPLADALRPVIERRIPARPGADRRLRDLAVAAALRDILAVVEPRMAALRAQRDAYAGRPVDGSQRTVPGGVLSARELAVLRLVAQGHTNRSAAGVLGVTQGFVEQRLKGAFVKLGARDRAQAVVLAIGSGQLGLDGLGGGVR